MKRWKKNQDLFKSIITLNWRSRAKLQKQAYNQNLPAAAIGELKKQLPGSKRDGGGAPIKTPDDAQVAILSLLSKGDRWVRHCNATVEKLAGAAGKRVPAAVKEVAKEGVERLKAVARAAKKAEKELQRLSVGK